MAGISKVEILNGRNVNIEKRQSNKPYWILQRKIPRANDNYDRNIVGECLISNFDELSLDDTVSHCLKNHDGFRQGFKLMPKDRLDIVLPNKTLSFELGKQGWHHVIKRI